MRAWSADGEPRRCASPTPVSRLCSRPSPRSDCCPGGSPIANCAKRCPPLLGMSADEYSQGRMTYDLRRLRLHGLIERIPHTHRYAVTDLGVRVALFYHRVFVRVLRPALSHALDPSAASPSPLNRLIRRFDREIQRLWEGIPLAVQA